MDPSVAPEEGMSETRMGPTPYKLIPGVWLEEWSGMIMMVMVWTWLHCDSRVGVIDEEWLT
jgi:hypothetical protein